jgi:hypothetical protein
VQTLVFCHVQPGDFTRCVIHGAVQSKLRPAAEPLVRRGVQLKQQTFLRFALSPAVRLVLPAFLGTDNPGSR